MNNSNNNVDVHNDNNNSAINVLNFFVYKNQFIWHVRDQIQPNLNLPVSEKSCTVLKLLIYGVIGIVGSKVMSLIMAIGLGGVQFGL